MLYAGILTVGGESVCSTKSIESSMNILDLHAEKQSERQSLTTATSKPSLVGGDWPGTLWSLRTVQQGLAHTKVWEARDWAGHIVGSSMLAILNTYSVLATLCQLIYCHLKIDLLAHSTD